MSLTALRTHPVSGGLRIKDGGGLGLQVGRVFYSIVYYPE